MKVGILCEFSGTVRDAFIALGHDAISCDLLPTEKPGPHIVGDCLAQNWSGFDLLICHPPCTHLAVSGARYFKNKLPQQAAALQFVRDLMALPVDRICIENPVSIISSRIRKPEQIIQPWMFGHAEAKKTCLWLKNLPPLVPTNILQKPASGIWNNQTPTGQNKLGPSAERWKLRSATYSGIAEAMATQWGALGLRQQDHDFREEYLNARAEAEAARAEANAAIAACDSMRQELETLLATSGYSDSAADARAMWAQRKAVP